MRIMWEAFGTVLVFLGLALLLLVNAVGVVLVLFQLPGTWLMVLATGLAVWWRSGAEVGVWPLVAITCLAVVGEIVELLPAAMRAKGAGGSTRGSLLSLAGAAGGAVLGTFILPVPVLGTVFGACLGAAVGSILGDRLAGREWELALRTGRAAAQGRFWGTIYKLIVAVVMWLIVAVAVFWPG